MAPTLLGKRKDFMILEAIEPYLGYRFLKDLLALDLQWELSNMLVVKSRILL